MRPHSSPFVPPSYPTSIWVPAPPHPLQYSAPPPPLSSPTLPLASSSLSLFTSWSKLVKLDLSTLAAFSCVFGYYLAGGPILHLVSLPGCALLAGTMLTAFSAAALNQWLEVPYDRLMERTRRRPLVTGAISGRQALLAVVAFAAAGAGLLAYASGGDWQAPAIALATVALYAFVYTRLKRLTPLNTEFGALVGSLPVLVGAATYHPFTAESLTSVPSLSALLGFAFMSAWQMPHFMMIAHQYAEQYARAGFRMRAARSAPGVGLAWAAALALLPFLGFHFHLTSPGFILSGSALNAYFLAHYARFYRQPLVYRGRAHIYLYFVAMFGLICLHAQANDGVHDVLRALVRQGLPLPACVVEYDGWVPRWVSDNAAFWEACPAWMRAVCGKVYHDELKRTGGMAGACPVVIKREVGEVGVRGLGRVEAKQAE